MINFMKIRWISQLLPNGLQNTCYFSGHFSVDKLGKRIYCFRQLDWILHGRIHNTRRHTSTRTLPVIGYLLPQHVPNMERWLSKRHMAHIPKNKMKSGVNSGAGYAYLYVIGTGAGGLGRSVLLRSKTKSYLFNCGEGAQKMIKDVLKPSFKGIDNIFFTYNTWSNVGGVLGLLLSKRSQFKLDTSLNLHGPPNVDTSIEFSTTFLDAFATVNSYGIDKVKYEDDQATVEYVEILSSVACKKEVRSDCQHEEASPSGNFEQKDMMTEKSHDMHKSVMAYIIRLKQKPLSKIIDIEKLFALNTTSGPWLKKLVEGEVVTLPDGRIVNPKDVVIENSGQVGPIAVIDCPTEDYLDILISNKQIMDLSAEGSENPEIIVHMAPVSIVEEKRYKDFIDRFDSETTHLMLNEKSPGPYLHAPQLLPSALNYLHKGMFPLLQGSINYNTKPAPQTGRIIQGCYGLKYTLRPTAAKGFDWKNLLYFDQSATLGYLKEQVDNELSNLAKHSLVEDEFSEVLSLMEIDIENELNKVASEIHACEGDKDVSDEYPEITFLGTGSHNDSSQRSVSGILVQMRKDEYLIMDCGEGTLLQMYLLYGQEKTNNILVNLKGIFVSHLHYDHFGGLFGLLDARSKAFGETVGSRLPIFAPLPMKRWLNKFSRLIDQQELNIEHIPSHTLYQTVKQSRTSYLSPIKNAMNLSELIVMEVIHAKDSHGLSIKHKDGWKLVYSGDTIPSKNLIRYGKDCDILIHEGTFDDQSVEEASWKRHSTASQAIHVGRQMNAKFTILTHFSQRFTKIPHFTENFTENVGFSFDFMQVRPSQLRLIPLLKPVLQLLFGANLQRRVRGKRNRNV